MGGAMHTPDFPANKCQEAMRGRGHAETNTAPLTTNQNYYTPSRLIPARPISGPGRESGLGVSAIRKIKSRKTNTIFSYER